MKCKSYQFSRHAIEQMFARSISVDNVKRIVQKGEIIQSYPHDKPYPSYLILHYIKKRPLHIVVAIDEASKACIIVTAYEPSINLWEDDFKTRK